MRKSINRLLSHLGFEISKIPNTKNLDERIGFTLYRFLKKDGSFDYEKYRPVQTAGNRRKIEKVWVSEENIAFLADYIKRVAGTPEFGICHGTRRGKEQEWFEKYLDCTVIGTEISDTAARFPRTIHWDFHEVKPEWQDSADFVYSNAIDHSYDPQKCMNAWMSCVKSGGVCILEHRPGHDRLKELDPFSASILHMPYLITVWGEGRYGVRQLIKAPVRSTFIVIQNF